MVRPQSFDENHFDDENVVPSANAKEYIKFVYTIRTWYGNESEGSKFSDELVTVYKTLADIHRSTDTDPKGWKINKRYTYEISVGLDQIYWAPSVENWEDAAFGDIKF